MTEINISYYFKILYCKIALFVRLLRQPNTRYMLSKMNQCLGNFKLNSNIRVNCL